MNERIKELAERATEYFPKTETSGEYWKFDKEKFAELIVRDCIENCRNQIMKKKDADAEGLDYNDGVMDCIVALKLHFGDKNE